MFRFFVSDGKEEFIIDCDEFKHVFKQYVTTEYLKNIKGVSKNFLIPEKLVVKVVEI